MALPLRPDKFRAWAKLCADALGAARAEIDGLNVFPVPDADTGTNAYLTFQAAHEAIAALPADADPLRLLHTYGEAILIGAKGNSGTILSELVRGSLRVLRDAGEISPHSVEAGFSAAAEAAYAAVGDPQEGTILTVAAEAARGAREAAAAGKDAREVFDAAAASARQALLDTPTQMELLARSGVVDAGGRALVVVLDATSQALTGRVPTPVESHFAVPADLDVAPDDLSEDGPAYEVMYLLRTDDDRIPGLRTALAALGDSLVVVGGEGLWNIHVHVDDVGSAIEAGLGVGKPFQISVTHFAEQLARVRPTTTQRIIISAVTGEGLAELTRDAGAVPLMFDADRPLSLDTMTRAIAEAAADEIIILPGREAHVPQFEAAAKRARDDGARVAVLRTTVQVQALAALAVHDPALPFDDVVVSMSAAAGHVRHGAVTLAVSDGMTMAGPCRAGDALGVVDGDFAVIGSDLADVAHDVLTALDFKNAELIAIVTGSTCPDGLAAVLEERICESTPHVDVVVYAGGQEHYPLFLAVE